MPNSSLDCKSICRSIKDARPPPIFIVEPFRSPGSLGSTRGSPHRRSRSGWFSLAPLHVYSETALLGLASGFQRFVAACPRSATAAYAMKACPAPAVLSVIRRRGFDVEVNSVTEYRQAIAAGFTANQIYINGVAKSVQFIDLALANGSRRINVDAIEEIDLIAARASALGRLADIHLRICPDVVAGAGAALMTGGKHSQFGILKTDVPCTDQTSRAASVGCIEGNSCSCAWRTTGYHLFAPYRRRHRRSVCYRARWLRHADGSEFWWRVRFRRSGLFRVSGADALCREISRLPNRLSVVFEPGRFLVERASSFYCQIAAFKRKAETTWLFLDAGYCHLTDRVIVGTRFPMQSLRAGDSESRLVRVAGPLCDSADVYQSWVGKDQAEGGRTLSLSSEISGWRYCRDRQCRSLCL